jgi:hypothetical protein
LTRRIQRLFTPLAAPCANTPTHETTRPPSRRPRRHACRTRGGAGRVELPVAAGADANAADRRAVARHPRPAPFADPDADTDRGRADAGAGPARDPARRAHADAFAARGNVFAARGNGFADASGERGTPADPGADAEPASGNGRLARSERYAHRRRNRAAAFRALAELPRRDRR